MESKIWNGLTVYEDGTVINKFGNEIGSISPKGYKYITINSKSYKNHRIVYQLFIGELIDGLVIDHIDSNKLNNHYTNLRQVTNRENISKVSERPNKSSKYTGVHYSKKRNKWQSQICINYKHYHLGYFNTEEEAHQAYQNKLIEINNNSIII